jgi:hypothetical protein
MRCPSCAKGSLVEIRMRVSGQELTFRRCGRCEAKIWTAGDSHVPLSHVLELARAR